MTDGRQTNGGARANAGRKRRAEKFETQIQRAEKKIADRLPWIVDKMFELADGVYVEKPGLTGPIIYQQAPDYKALAYLADRIMGKPTERKELTGADGSPIPVQFFNYDAAITELTHGSEDDPETPSGD